MFTVMDHLIMFESLKVDFYYLVKIKGSKLEEQNQRQIKL